MQSTEEYLDSLLASVSEDKNHNDSNENHKKHHKSIEDLDESELTEEALQKQLALLLGLETEEDMDFDDEPEDDFMAQYAAQMAVEEVETFDSIVQEMQEEPALQIPNEPIAMEHLESVAQSVAEPESSPEPVQETTANVAPTTSDSGVLSPDEIAALFASMEADNQSESVPEPESLSEPVQETTTNVAPTTSDSGVLSPDEIAALFASMGADDSESASENEETDITDEVLLGKTQGSEELLADDSGSITREELEELGLGDIADVLVDGEQEILSGTVENDNFSAMEPENEEPKIEQESEEERQIIDIPDFGEEMLLELENVDAMLEATAKMAKEENADTDADSMAEEDIMAMLSQFEEESIQESMAAQEESEKAAQEAVNRALEEETTENAELSENVEDGKAKRKKAKKEKVKKEKQVKEKPVKEKKDKVSLKDKILAFMFEDESLDDGEGEKVPLGDGDGLAYMDLPTEEPVVEAKPAKKKKEKAPKKNKKEQKAASSKAKDENAEIAAELAAEDKKKDKKKEKPKKEKKPKKVVIADASANDTGEKDSKKGIGAKGIVATLLVCASLLGLILVGTYFVPTQLSLIQARTAFYAQDYEETTMRLMGRDLNSSDRILYDKANLLYGLEERYHQSEIYLKSGKTKETLNSLLQGVVACNKEEVLANQLGIDTEWQICKERFMLALQEQYGLDAETVEAICALRNPDYTVAVENILAGRMYDDKSAFGGVASDSDSADAETGTDEMTGSEETLPGGLNPNELEDLLPEEEAILEQLQQETTETEEVSESDVETTGDNELYSGSVEGGEVNFVE
ncbi:MAG: hypothetical protein J6A80_02810 [Lachnospiraceae bacterium]|nr:hypothetical protein [Lachnospiraceae bacterium]